MNNVVVDAGALSALATADPRMVAIAEATQRAGGALIVPTVVIAESTSGRGSRDAKVNRVLNKAVKDSCDEQIARRAAGLRHAAEMGRHASIDAIVVATAEATSGRRVATEDPEDLRRLAAAADHVRVVDYRNL